MGPRQQGDLGEIAAQSWLIRNGWAVFAPVNHSPDIDLIAVRGGEQVRVQVKTSGARNGDRWLVSICTRGGNQSWNGMTKLFSCARCDYLFVLAADGRQWFIPSEAVGGGTGILVGGPKYRRFEIERGHPFLATAAA